MSTDDKFLGVVIGTLLFAVFASAFIPQVLSYFVNLSTMGTVGGILFIGVLPIILAIGVFTALLKMLKL